MTGRPFSSQFITFYCSKLTVYMNGVWIWDVCIVGMEVE